MINLSSMQDVMTILKNALSYKTTFIVWQAKEDEKIKVKMKIIKVDTTLREVHLQFIERTRFFQFLPQTQLFAHAMDLNILLKCHLKSVDEKCMVTTFPSKVKILEQRNNDRIQLANDNIPITFKNVSPQQHFSDGTQVHKGIIQNVSPTGCLIRFLNSQFDDFSKGDLINVISLSDNKIEKLEGVIRHTLTLGKMGGVEIIQFGVQFSKPISKFDMLLKIIDNYLKSQNKKDPVF